MPLIYLILLLGLVSCGDNGSIDQPVATPPAFGSPKTLAYKPILGTPRYCSAVLLINGNPAPSGSYSISCEYNSSGYVKNFLITYYYSLPGIATLSYQLY